MNNAKFECHKYSQECTKKIFFTPPQDTTGQSATDHHTTESTSRHADNQARRRRPTEHAPHQHAPSRAPPTQRLPYREPHVSRAKIQNPELFKQGYSAPSSSTPSMRRRYTLTATAVPTKATEPSRAILSGKVPSGRGPLSWALASSFEPEESPRDFELRV